MANEMRMFLMTRQGRDAVERQARKHLFVIDPAALYEDQWGAIYGDRLVIKKFFIPSLLYIEIVWLKIVSVTYIPQNNDKKVPGKGMDQDGFWWAKDVLRPHPRELHLYNVRIEVADMEPHLIGFTVVHIDKFLKACRHLLPYSCKLSGCMWSE